MKLIDAYNLLVEDGIADNHRYFAEVYKLYNFADGDNLQDYLDFIMHEPVMWLNGFPAKLTTKLAFSKPKTAVIKLLKKQSVIAALGADYAGTVHTTIWNVFKKEADRIVEVRAAKAAEETTSNTHVVVEKSGNNRHRNSGGNSTVSGYTYRCDESDDAAAVSMDIESLETASVGSVETLEEPIPPLRSYKTITVYPTSASSAAVTASATTSTSTVSAKAPADSESARVELLKAVLFKMSQTLPDGVGDAFRLLVSHV